MTSPSLPLIQPSDLDVVHFVSSFYDCPIEGLADFKGAPYLFFLKEHVVSLIEDPSTSSDRIVDEDDNDDEPWFDVERTYALYPVAADIVSEMMEQNDIFERWHQAYSLGQGATHQNHPALPEDRERYDLLSVKNKAWRSNALNTLPSHVVSAEFKSEMRPVPEGSSRYRSYMVKWVSE